MLSRSETSAAAMAALRPAAPPPTMTMSYAIVSTLRPLRESGAFLPGPAGHRQHPPLRPIPRKSNPVEHDRPLDLLDGLGDLDPPGAGLGAVEGGSAPEHAGPVRQDVQAVRRPLVPRVEDEPVGVDDRRRAHVVAVTPEDGAGRGAGGAQDALGRVVVSLSLFGGLPPLPVRWLLVVDQVGEHPLVALEERLHVHDPVLP